MKIGLDIGGTKITAIRFDGGVVEKNRVETLSDQPLESILTQIKKAVESVWTDDVESIGVSCAGFFADDTLVAAHNLGELQGANIPDFLSQFSVPVVCENDANCFAFAEQQLGAAKDSKVCIGVIQGTGVGGGIIIDGKIFSGANGGAGEIGHFYNSDGHDWEDYISGTAFSKWYAEFGGQGSTFPADIWNEQSEAADKAREEFTSHTAMFLGGIINAFNPDCIVLGGGLANLPNNYYDIVWEKTKKFAIAHSYDVCSLKRFEISDDSGAIGACLL